MPEIVFKGKEYVYNHHLTVPYRPLVVDAAKGIGPADLASNLVIRRGAQRWTRAISRRPAVHLQIEGGGCATPVAEALRLLGSGHESRRRLLQN